MKTKDSTVLPYVLGGKDDPHFSGDGMPPYNLSAAPVLTELESLQCKSIGQGCGTQPLEDIGGNWTPDRIEANEDRYGKPWYEREDWEVPGNGGTNDHLFEDDLFEDGDPQEYGDGSPD